MSITFYLASNETAYPGCVGCEGRANFDPRPDSDCKVCDGYGPDGIDSTPSLNVANANGGVILRDLLGYADSDPIGGELDADDVAQRLAVAAHRVDALTCLTYREGHVIDCGRSREQVESYVKRLGDIVDVALRRGEPILYG